MIPTEFIPKAIKAARDAGHIWPEYAACEAALESAWGESRLAKTGNNLFGQKHGLEHYPTVTFTTREFRHGYWVVETAEWPKFPDWATSCRERMALLERVKAYKPALEAKDGESFVRLVSSVWATDPERANKVLSIYRHHISTEGRIS